MKDHRQDIFTVTVDEALLRSIDVTIEALESCAIEQAELDVSTLRGMQLVEARTVIQVPMVEAAKELSHRVLQRADYTLNYSDLKYAGHATIAKQLMEDHEKYYSYYVGAKFGVKFKKFKNNFKRAI